ncbi:MAG: trypsin-like peptidase domain-containing protein [Proteobacteria bacterium]|nr:trypsin-like peptidase domain-containing protein [Pseudomonadota bacterium]
MRKTGSFFAAVAVALALGACSVTLDVYSIVGGDEVYTGSTTGTAEGGSMTLQNGKGGQCIGQRVGNISGGNGFLNCSDGVRAQIQYVALSMMTGYGFGTASDGRSIRFTYGLSREEGAKYLGGAIPAAASASTAPPTKKSSGTGFFITRQGHLLTNAHVVKDCKEIDVSSVGGGSSTATLLKRDERNDLALLQAGAPRAVAGLRSARQVRQGETVVAFGFPLPSYISSGGALTTGTVSALAGPRDDSRYLQMSTQIQPGNSGGPLLDTTGAVVGVTTASLNDVELFRRTGSVPQNVNFALKVDVVRTFLDSAGVAAETSTGGRELSLPDIGERARAFTVVVECKR